MWCIVVVNIHKSCWFILNLQPLISLHKLCQLLIGGVFCPLMTFFWSIASFHWSMIRLAFFYASSKCQVAFIIVFCNLAAVYNLHFAFFPVMVWLFTAIGVLSGCLHTTSFQTCALSHCKHACNTAKKRNKGYHERQTSNSDWEPSHSLLPIKTFCQARMYKK